MKMKKRYLIALLLAVVWVWAAGTVAAAPKGKLVIGLAGAPSTFDPHRITSFPANMQYPLVFDNLVFRDPAGKIVPRLATSWRVVKPTVWEFKLRKGIKFSNGEPVDAHAVKYSIERIIDPKLKSRQYGYFRSIDHAEVVDRYTVRIHTKYPDTFLVEPLTSYGQIVPPKYYKSHDLKYLARHPVGSGPYRLVRWKKGQEFVYEAKPNYWMPGVPRIKRGVIKIISEPTTRVSALVAGDVDMINAVPPQLLPLVEANPKVEVVSGEGQKVCRITIIIKPGSPWEKVEVRKALNYAVDKDSIVKHILQGYAKKVAVLQGPKSFGYNPDLKAYPYDPARARKLLAEAGYPNGFSVELWVPIGRYIKGKQAAEAIAGQMDKVGVKVRVRTVEYGKIVRLGKSRWKPQVKPYWQYGCRNDMHLHADSMYAGNIHSRSLRGGFRNKVVDKLIDDARATMDTAIRIQKYREINRLLLKKYVPLIYLFRLGQINAKKKRVDWTMRANGVMLLSEAGWKAQN
ncbi:ABC transporter substrate-binding protein [Nitrospinota bacterium]